ncbi:hypothetical protein BB561_005898 [Smittium simulii]|uniref:ABC transporter domain-containing protein n=1 Tax=Smittium simulii TaxID=133385 RepID=A0A2T9Y7Q3_9FUNG|nr:hypothetical protein BB561_005898 [Smittium simulii]
MNTLSLQNVSYYILEKSKKKKIPILKNLNLELNGGKLTAIIGTSGSGKTSLLNIIGGRVESGIIEGIVRYNGKKRVPAEYKKIVSFVEQELMLLSSLTVKETLSFTTNLFHSLTELKKEEQEELTNTFLSHFKLNDIEKSRIGSVSKRGISGGEKKRAVIASKLITKPKILILDEPTTGLDSSSTHHIVSLLKKATQMFNLITISSIHQPSQETFLLFDQVIITSSYGIVYCGPTDKVAEYFDSLGYYCPEFENPVDYYLSVITHISGTEKQELGCSTRIKKIVDSWQRNPLLFSDSQSTENINSTSSNLNNSVNLPSFQHASSQTNVDIAQICPNSVRYSLGEPIVETDDTHKWPNTSFQEFKIILKRSWTIQIREPELIYSYLFMSTFAGLVLGFTYYNTNTLNKIQNTTGITFLCCLYLLFLVALPLMLILDEKKRYFAYERSYRMYRVSSFFFALMFTILPIILISNFIMMIETYFLAKFQLVFYNCFSYSGTSFRYTTAYTCFTFNIWWEFNQPQLNSASYIMDKIS